MYWFYQLMVDSAFIFYKGKYSGKYIINLIYHKITITIIIYYIIYYHCCYYIYIYMSRYSILILLQKTNLFLIITQHYFSYLKVFLQEYIQETTYQHLQYTLKLNLKVILLVQCKHFIDHPRHLKSPISNLYNTLYSPW